MLSDSWILFVLWVWTWVLKSLFPGLEGRSSWVFSQEDNYLLIFWCPVWVWKSSKWLLILKCFSWIISAVSQTGRLGAERGWLPTATLSLALADNTRIVSDLSCFWALIRHTLSLWRIAGGFPSGTPGGDFSQWLFLCVCLLFYFSHCEGKMCINTFVVENSDELKKENTNKACFFIVCILNYRWHA